jgi:hypothetical protein
VILRAIRAKRLETGESFGKSVTRYTAASTFFLYVTNLPHERDRWRREQALKAIAGLAGDAITAPIIAA